MSSKNCSTCQTIKPFKEFSKNKSTETGYSHVCKSCVTEYMHTKKGLVTKIYSAQRERSRQRNHHMPTFNLPELRQWVFDQPNFELLYHNWQMSGFNKKLTPSCDRLNDYMGYSLDNIRLVTWQENYNKGMRDRKNGNNNKQNKKVTQIDFAGNIVATHHSARQASRDTGINLGNLANCCRGGKRSAGGFYWKYV